MPPPEVSAAIYEADTFELWPENLDSLTLFMRMQTQWRIGPAGASGLDYAGVSSALRFLRVRPTPEFFDDLQIMETAALRAMRGK